MTAGSVAAAPPVFNASFHRSHFGSRCKLGRCVLAGLFLQRSTFLSNAGDARGEARKAKRERKGSEKSKKPKSESENHRWSCAGHALQRSLLTILAHGPITASSAQFCLLCCQPEPLPESLTARMSQPTSRDPCRLPA